MSKKETKRGSRGASAVKRGDDRATIILELFKSFPGRQFTLKSLASASGGSDKVGRYKTKEVIDNLLKNDIIEVPASGKYKLSAKSLPSLEGVVDMLPSGSAYVSVQGVEEDIYIDERNMKHALFGDRVKVVITHTRRNGKPEGEVIEIVERADRLYVGVAEITRNHAFLRVDSRKMPYDIFLYTKDTEVKSGDKVVVRIKEWPSDTKSPVGEIVDILGPAGDNDAEMHAILAEFNLPYKYPEEVEEAANKISEEITAEEIAKRRDFRQITTFTIDPVTAKDFDDALSIRSIGENKWEVGVHIADVTHYVNEGGIIDLEGRERATSVYLVDRTVPMLPEKLSNELCSLRPNEDKLAFSAVFEIDGDGNVTKEWFGRTVIRSIHRFTYEQAQTVIETGEGDCKDEILTLNSLAQKLREERFRKGAITFVRDEAQFQLDEKGKPTGIFFKEQKESNQLIEEFMLLANRKVAEFIGAKRGEGKNAERTFIYRVHDKPNPEKLAKFTNFILKFGYYFKAERVKEISKEMNKLMGEIRGKAEENVISTLAIRTMAKAFYSVDNTGHYGLAFPYYTHFTSPIRRYPDMMAHRLLARYLAGGASADRPFYEEQSDHSSKMEVLAAEAERASIKYKMVEFMKDYIGCEFNGAISGVTEWGIYVELENHIEGMVSVRDMVDDFYDFDEDNYAMRGAKSGRILTLGDKVVISVKNADLLKKQLDFTLVATVDFKTGKLYPFEENNLSHDNRKNKISVKKRY